MNAHELAERLGAAVLNNKLRHPDTGVVLARYEETGLELTPEGVEVAAAMPAAPAKTPRVRKITAVESVAVASDASVASAPVEAPQSDAAPTE